MEILKQDILTEFIRIICNSATSINYKKKNIYILQVFQNTRNGRIIGNLQQISNSIPMKI